MNKYFKIVFASLLLPLGLVACNSAQKSADAEPGSEAANARTVGAVLPASQEESPDRQRARIRLELAASYYQKGSYAIALEELRNALLADPKYPAAYGLLGLVYMDLNENSKAGDTFQQGLKFAPNDSDLNNSYGWFLCQNKQERQSIAFFERAAKNPLYQTPGKPWANAGLCLRRAGDDKTAEGHLLQAFRLDPANPIALFNLAEIYLKQGDADKARFYSQRLMNTYESSAQILWLALKVERQRGNKDSELAIGARLRSRFPASPEANLLAQGRFND